MPIRRLQALRGAPAGARSRCWPWSRAFVATLAARWNDVISLKWRLEPGLFAVATALVALSYGLVACLWGLATCTGPPAPGWPPGPGSGSSPTWPATSRATSGAMSARSSWPGARAWPGGPRWPSWPSPRSSRSGWRCWPGCLLLAERARLGRPALLGAVVVAAGAALAAVFRRHPRAGPPAPARVRPHRPDSVSGHGGVAGGRLRRLLGRHRPGLRRPGGQPLPPGPGRRAPGDGRLRRRLRGRVPRPPHPGRPGRPRGVLVVALAPVLPAGPAAVLSPGSG